MKNCRLSTVAELIAQACLVLFCHSNAQAADVSLSMSASAEEQQTAQPGLVFNRAIFAQVMPTSPNYFVSTRVTAGRRIQYVVAVNNLDSVNASPNVFVSIVFPKFTELYQGSLTTSAGASCQARPAGHPDGSLLCDVGAIAASGTSSISFQLITDQATPAGAVLLAGASASMSGDTNLGNNFATAQNTVLTAADMTAVMATIGYQSVYSSLQDRILDVAATNSVTAGNVLQHRVEVQNSGPSFAPAALIRHTLPSGVNFEYAVGARCIHDATALNVIFCELTDLEAPSRVAYDLFVTVDPFTANSSNLQSCVDALSGGSNTSPPGPIPGVNFDPPLQPLVFDPFTSSGNNNICTTTVTGTLVDANLTFSGDSFLADQQGGVHYVPVVRNDGRSGMLSATLTLNFAQGLTPRGGDKSCLVNAQTATCAVKPLSPGESQSFDMVASVDLISSTVSALGVSAALSDVSPVDANSSNNTAQTTTVVRPALDPAGTASALNVSRSDFDIDSGTWGINNRGDFFTFEAGTARALVKRSKLKQFTAGTLQTAVRLLRYKDSKPNASVIFSHQSSKAYRFVKAEIKGTTSRIIIGQKGDFGGEKSGIKAFAKFPFKVGKVYNLTVKVDPDGTVEVRINNSAAPVVTYRFSQGALSGRTGFEAAKARAAYDGLSVLSLN